MTVEKIAEKQVGKRTILGTDWPVVNTVYRFRDRNGKVHCYRADYMVCNGIASGSAYFWRKAPALHAATVTLAQWDAAWPGGGPLAYAATVVVTPPRPGDGPTTQETTDAHC